MFKIIPNWAFCGLRTFKRDTFCALRNLREREKREIHLVTKRVLWDWQYILLELVLFFCRKGQLLSCLHILNTYACILVYIFFEIKKKVSKLCFKNAIAKNGVFFPKIYLIQRIFDKT